jgi:hypothetical protein
MAEPTVSELVRQVGALVEQVTRLADRLDRDYIRRDVYTSNRIADDRRFNLIEDKDKNRDENAADTRRQLIVGIALAGITALLALLLSVRFVIGGG